MVGRYYFQHQDLNTSCKFVNIKLILVLLQLQLLIPYVCIEVYLYTLTDILTYLTTTPA